MMYLFYAVSGSGKSALKTAMLEPFLRNSYKVKMDSKGLFEFLALSPKQRLKISHNRIKQLSVELGENFDLPKTTIQSNETMWSNCHGDYVQNYDLPGDKIGLYDELYETYCPCPGSILAWDEAQKELSGRESQSMDSRVSSLLQLHRKWGLDILFFTQRSRILDLNVRDNARIIEIESMHHKYNKFGRIIQTTWRLKFFENLSALERYIGSGKKTYHTTTFTFDGCIYEHFDSNEGEEYFKDLAKHRGLNLRIRERGTKFDEYVKIHPYTPPVGYAKMKPETKEKKIKELKKQNNQKDIGEVA